MIFFTIWWQHCALNLHLSVLLCCYVIKQDWEQFSSYFCLVEICQAIAIFNVHAGKRFYKSILCSFSFLIFRLLAVLLFVFMLILLEMHLGFLIIVFLKNLLTMVKIYQGEFFVHVSDRRALQKSKRLMTSLQFAIRSLISKLLKSIKYP